MNGLPLVVLGVMFFTLAYSLLKVQGKIGDIAKAVDRGFKTIEDAISVNLIDQNGPMGGISGAVDTNLAAIKRSVSETINGRGGVLEKMDTTFTTVQGITDRLAMEIKGGRDLLTGTVAPIVGDTQTIFDDIGKPLNEASATIKGIGDFLDVNIFGTQPLEPLAKPFYDVSATVCKTGGLCLDVSMKIGSIGGDITTVADKLDSVKGEIIELRSETESMHNYLNYTLKMGERKFNGDIDDIHSSINGVLSSFKAGAETSLKELADARAFLDSTLGKLINRQWIAALAVAGMALILAGASMGI